MILYQIHRMIGLTMPSADAVDADSHIRPYLINERYHPICSLFSWFQISHGGRNVIGPYIPLDNKDMICRFMGAEAANARRRAGFVFLQNGEVIGAVLTETILDYITILYGRFENPETFKLLITNQLILILIENDGTPILPEQINVRLGFLRPMFPDFNRLLEAVKQIANGSNFRLQFVDV